MGELAGKCGGGTPPYAEVGLMSTFTLAMVSTAASVALAVLTLFYVVWTGKLVRQGRMANIVGQVVYDDGDDFYILLFEVVNAGPAPAWDIRGTFDPDPVICGGVKLSTLYGRISHLGAGQRLRCVLASSVDDARLSDMYPDGQLKVRFNWHDESTRAMRSWENTELVRRYHGTVVHRRTTPSEEALSDLADIAKILLEERTRR